MADATIAATQNESKPLPPALLRWLILILLGIGLFGNYYVYDSIAPLAKILEQQLGFSDSAIGTLNAVYSIPNLIMVLIGGLIIDRIGTRKAAVLFAAICVAGAVITALFGNLLGMTIGRLVFGLGAESMIVATSAAVAKWFRGSTLSFAFAMKITISRLGSFAAENSPSWAAGFYDGWQGPLVIAAVIMAAGLAGCIVYAATETGARKRYRIADAGESDEVRFSQIFNFGRSYWLIVLLCVTFYAGIFPFKTFAIKMFQDFGASHAQAGFLSSLTTLFALFFTPLFGILADRVGHRSKLMMVGSALLIPVYVMMGSQALPLIVPMAMMGIAYSLIPAVMWPSVAYVVEEHQVGTAYGLMTMVQNVGLVAFNFGIGFANDLSGAGAENTAGYWPGLLIFSSVGFIGLLWAWLLYRSETGPHGHGLERRSPTQAVREEEEAAVSG
jgi:MFS family permease